jgi:hypothetical protein
VAWSALALVTGALATPYVVRAPGYFREDWVSLDYVRAGGPWAAAGPTVGWTRPGVNPVYAAVFGPLGGHPRLGVLALVAIAVTTAVLLYEVALRWLDACRAFAVAAVYALLPTHASLTHWISAAHVGIALSLTLAGVLAADLLLTGRLPWWPAALFLAAAGLTYESFVPATLVVLLAFPLAHRPRRWRPVVPLLVTVIGVTAYAFIAGFVLAAKQPVQLIELDRAIGGNLGWGLSPVGSWPVLQAVLLGGTAAALAAMAFPSFRRATGLPERLVAAGAGLVVLGVAPFVPFGADVDFVGLGDRANALPAMGVACILVGLADRSATFLAAIVPRRVTVAVLAALGLTIVLPTHWAQAEEWARVATWQEQVLDRAAALVIAGRNVVTVGPDQISTPAVEGLNGDWDGSAALRWRTGDPDAAVRFNYRAGAGTAPPPVDVPTDPP